MTVLRIVAAALTLLLAISIPALANASDEFADAEITIEPRVRATFFSNAFSAAEGTVSTAIRLPGSFPAYPKITPMKVADVGFPPSSLMTFNPKRSMPVCPDDQLGPPPTTNSIPVPNMLTRCPGALLGNGTAVFALAQSTSPAARRDGELLIFNGGLVGGLPKIKIYAYSYDIQVGIYTSAVLQPDGRLRFDMPKLPFDSAITEINLSIPGKPVVLPKPDLGITVRLPAGLDQNYIQARCVGSAGLPWRTDLTLGERATEDDSTEEPELVVSDSGVAPCRGVSAAPRLAELRVTGPIDVVRNRLTVFRVKVRNLGGTDAKGGLLSLSGRGVSATLPVGSIPGGRTRTFTIRTRFQDRGLVRATIRLNTSNAGSRVASRSIKVR
jgi:hypothetical protein